MNDPLSPPSDPATPEFNQGKPSIDPSRVTRPFQLLAAWLVALLTLCSAFLVAARTIQKPEWAAGFLIVVAVALVPIFLGCMFLLQTRFRPQMQEDRFYLEYVREERKANVLTNQLRQSMASAGLTSEAVALGKSLETVSSDTREDIHDLMRRIQESVSELKSRGPTEAKANPSVALELGKALAAEGKWLEAARQLSNYLITDPSDWETQFLRGVAYINARESVETNIQGLRAYNEAITFAGQDIDRNRWSRLHAYRGAALKRLNRLDEAEADLLLARRYATAAYEKTDIASNLAGVYALRGDREKMLEEVRRVRHAPAELAGPYVNAIRSHLTDYFHRFKDDPELLQILK